VELYIDQAEEFVQELFDEKHMMGVDLGTKGANEESNDAKPQSVPLEQASPGTRSMSSPRKDHMQLIEKMNLQPAERDMYERFMMKVVVDDGSTTLNAIDAGLLDRKRAEVKAAVSTCVKEYVSFCRRIKLQPLLLKFGNEKYKKECREIDLARVNPPFNDTFYAQRYFDVTQWWLNKGAKRFPIVAVAASIVLGKPSHNGFQERVFSRGTFFDSALKQRMKEENFEMSVLNSLTQDKVSELVAETELLFPAKSYESGRKDLDRFFERERYYSNIFTENEVEIHSGDDLGESSDDSNSVEVSVCDDISTTTELDGNDDWSILTKLDREDDAVNAANSGYALEESDNDMHVCRLDRNQIVRGQ
jgi:hypothetical protein